MTAQFDMFSDEVSSTLPKAGRQAQLTQSTPSAMSEDGMVDHLVNTGRYRVLRKLESRAVAITIRPEFPLRGVILDTETTGLNHLKDEIIEIGIIAFTFDAMMADCNSRVCPFLRISPS